MKPQDKKNPEYEEELSQMNIGEEQTPLQRRAETERREADNAAHAARSDVKRRRARKARQVYTKQRKRKLELGEATSKEIKDLVIQYNKIKGKSAKMSGRDIIINGKKTKADDALETMAAAVMKLESVSQIATFVEYHELEEALNQRGRRVRPDGQVSKHEPGSMATRPETESPSGEMAREYRGGRGTPAERYAAAKKKIQRLSTQNKSGQSVKTNRETEKRRDSLRKSVY